MINYKFLILVILICFTLLSSQAVNASDYKYPDYAYEFLGLDKHENFNRKMFNFNRGLNKYLIRPIHVIWASILPQYAMDRINGVSKNIEYPIRLMSNLVQKDFRNAGNETKRFLINTTIGLAGMFDPAKHILNIYISRDDMDKALSRRNIKLGNFFVAPVIVFTSPRDIFGRILDTAFNPTTYIGSPIVAIVKAGMTINETAYWQTLIYIVEASYADPYEITKTAFGIDKYIKMKNFDRVNIVSEFRVKSEQDDKLHKNNDVKLNVSAEIVKDSTNIENDETEIKQDLKNVSIEPNIVLANYYPQSPVTDSMRTMLLSNPDVSKSIWNEVSPWNRSFMKRLKTSSVNLAEGRDNYKFLYLLQKDKNSPLAIVIPSTGDGIYASHAMTFAKMFYDSGYSVVIHGNPFQWEYVKSMPSEYKPGLPASDASALRASTNKIIKKLQNKYGYSFENKVLFGTSLAAIDILFLANQEFKDNTLGNTQYIALCPPIDLFYSLNQVDKFADEWQNFSDDLKDKVAYASAKLVNFYLNGDDIDYEVNRMPFDEDEAKLITSFIMHQKLSDVIFTIENAPTNKKSNVYDDINKMSYKDYFNKYIKNNSDFDEKTLEQGVGLISISDYLKTANNYKIYHTKNDYLINSTQLKQLKKIAGDNLIILNNGSHLGFTYRSEFQTDLKNTINQMNYDL